ncbi:T9SS type A sorting domain-containing protein [Siphonobacter curvatus]|uniref:Secretion system C-terminal sorting domain-containing protein n=1 Tax=Siphonobacter curvatus TaxID=2094562 RepID=A0A2S7IJU1_9BACT|nr:T9SS type A sorting domain-containing protein [Siphonobacter curvatus]PQA56959.1 hypothetical protein C5O19_16635 [Siphonobacter curvatus]
MHSTTKRYAVTPWISAAIALLLSPLAGMAQSTTLGGDSSPVIIDGGTVSDYSPDGLFILADGSMTLLNNSTFEHGNSLFNNRGAWLSTSSLDLFAAQGNGTIAGTIAPNFANLRFNIGANVMAITNSQGINVAGTLNFHNGITTTVRSATSLGAIHFGTAAVYGDNNASDTKHVDGYVSKRGSTPFFFPVGSGTDYRPLQTLSVPTGDNEYAVAWITGDPTTTPDPSDGGSTHPITAVGSGIMSVSPAGQWDWITVQGTADQVNVRVSMPDMTGFATAQNLRLVGWNGTQWIDLSGGATATGNQEDRTITGTIPTGATITALAIGSVSSALPVSLARFEVSKEGNAALLTWLTAQEKNTKSFEVEHSLDGRSWRTIGSVAAKGNSTAEQRYSFLDTDPANGINYYRLRMVDFDGYTELTRSQSIAFELAAQASVYPNPVADVLTLHVKDQTKLQGVQVLSSMGTTVYRTSSPGSQLSMQGLSKGLYVVRLQFVNGTVETFKVIKQ